MSVSTDLEQLIFSNWIINSDYLIAVFNKDIKTCTSITASSETPVTIIPISIIGKQIKFDWTTGTVNFTFYGITSVDDSINLDSFTVEGPIILNRPKIIGWRGNQPTEENTIYNLSVLFDKELSNSIFPVITATDEIVPHFTSISGSQVNFTVITSSTPSSTIYTLSNVTASDGSITPLSTISCGAKINSVEVETDLSDSFVEMYNLVIGRTQKVRIIFSKPISGTLSFVPNLRCIFGIVTMINSSTAEFTITPVNTITDYLRIETNNIISEDGGQSILSDSFNLVYNQKIINLFESSNLEEVKTTFDVGITVSLSLQVSKPIASDLSETTITCENGSVANVSISNVLEKYYYNFDFTPTSESTNETIKVNQAKDIYNLKYTISSDSLHFKKV